MKYFQGKFRNNFEKQVLETVKEQISWCNQYAEKGMAKAFHADAYHNVQTKDFHGELSEITTFSSSQSREIDVLLEVDLPQKYRLLISVKKHASAITLEHLGDMESLLQQMKKNEEWCYLGMVVGRRGFQSGCEETAKRADIALVPPITGNPEWFKVITLEEIIERLSDAVRSFLLFGVHWLQNTKRDHGDFYNEIFIITREPSGLPGNTNISAGKERNISMSKFVEEALQHPENQFVIPLSRERNLHPLFKPVEIMSADDEGNQVVSHVRSIVSGKSTQIKFYKVQTANGREMIADGQRALYVIDDNNHRRLVRVDQLKVGQQILVADENGGSKPDAVIAVYPESES